MFSRLCTLITLLVLTGCNSTINSTKIDKKKTLDTNHGVVGVQVINNNDELARLHKGWTEVIVVRMDNFDKKKQQAFELAKSKAKSNAVIDEDKVKWEPDFYTLEPTLEGVIDSQIFIGSMPQGTYMISSLYSVYNGSDITSWLSMPVNSATGLFDVKQGKLTNLGTVVFQPLLNIKEPSFWNTTSSQKAYVTRIDEQKKLDKYVLSNYPKLAESIDLSEILGWNEDNLSGLRQSLSELSRQNAYGNTAIALKQHGQRAIAAKFGQLRWQDKQGQWQQINLDTNGQLAAVLEMDNQVAIAGERGQMFVADNFSSTWTALDKVSPQEAIIWFGKGKQYYAMTQTLNQYHFYQFSNLESDWARLRSFERKTNNFWVVNGKLFPFVTKTGELSVINDNKRYQYNSQTQSWTEYKTDSLAALAQLDTGDLVALEVSQWDGVGNQVISQDSGETWTSINRHLSGKDGIADNGLPVILDDGTVITLGRPSQRGKSTGELKIISTDLAKASNKANWDFHADAKEGCYTLLPQISRNDSLYFLCDRGDIAYTTDLGKTWEYVVDLDIAEMQARYEQMIQAIKAEHEAQQAASASANQL